MSDDELFKKGVLAIAQDLHMSVTGAAIMYWEDSAKLADYLKRRLAEWKPAHPTTRTYDAIVMALCACALAEHEDDASR